MVICNQDELIEYLNQYLTYIIGTKRPLIIETNFKNNTHILRTSNDSYVRFTSIKLAYDFWVKYDKKKTSYEFQWIPFTINTTTINDQIFNTFFSFKHQIPKTIKKQEPSHNLI